MDSPPPSASGYRNLFGDLRRDAGGDPEAFQGYGERTRDIVEKLARVLEQPYRWASTRPGARFRDENPQIPAGYTYLAQFVAHDLTFLGSTLPPLDDPFRNAPNFRSIALDLETIYGGGPLERPSSYSLEASGAPRLRLRVGLLRESDGRRPRGSKRRAELARDLPRTSCPLTVDSRPNAKALLTEVLVSDPRNDDHLIVAQLTALFHLLHNEICERLPAVVPPQAPEHLGDGTLDEWALQGLDLFVSARRLVSTAYRRIVRSDLMERLLCGPVYARYRERPGSILDRTGGGAMPVEFSHAAFRVGHAMVRPGYVIRHEQVFGLEEVLRFSSDVSPDRMPARPAWAIHWPHFFETEGRPPANLSRRLAPSQTRVLSVSPLISLADDRSQPTLRTGLPRRDLLRGATVPLRSVESLIRCVASSAPDLVAGSRLLSDPAHRRDSVQRFLDVQMGTGEPLSDDDKAMVAADPPLLLFLLLEAALEQDGLCLGVLGSVIVAEVIFRALNQAKSADAERVARGEVPDIEELAKAVFPPDAEALAQGRTHAMPESMPDLIRFLRDLPSFKDVKPAFA